MTFLFTKLTQVYNTTTIFRCQFFSFTVVLHRVILLLTANFPLDLHDVARPGCRFMKQFPQTLFNDVMLPLHPFIAQVYRDLIHLPPAVLRLGRLVINIPWALPLLLFFTCYHSLEIYWPLAWLTNGLQHSRARPIPPVLPSNLTLNFSELPEVIAEIGLCSFRQGCELIT